MKKKNDLEPSRDSNPVLSDYMPGRLRLKLPLFSTLFLTSIFSRYNLINFF